MSLQLEDRVADADDSERTNDTKETVEYNPHIGNESQKDSETDLDARKEQKCELGEQVVERGSEREHLTNQAENSGKLIVGAGGEPVDEAMSRFLANISHELRTPLNGILGMNSILLGSGLTMEQAMYVKAIHSSGIALLKIIDDVLDFSKIEAGKLLLEVIDFDLRTTIEGIVSSYAYRAKNKNLKLSSHVTPETPSLLRGDPGRLRQILVNLIENALKFTDQGEISITVDIESESSEEVFVKFEIKDTGIGIPEEKIKDLFKPFNQLDGSLSRRYAGIGLGLSISKQIVELMDGEIGVSSQSGKGSKFAFTARLRKQVDNASVMNYPKPGMVESAKNFRVLGVDDNETNRAILNSCLNAWGFRYDVVENAQQALEKLHDAVRTNDPYHIAILDMVMAGMDGQTLGKEIKRDETIHQTRLVMMTSLAGRGDLNVMKAIGFDCYLPKPVKQSELYDCLMIMLAGSNKKTGDPTVNVITRHTVREIRRSNVRILIVEDNRINQQVVLNVIKKLGFSADIAENGKLAVDVLKRTQYDLVLMDCQMPEMDGYEAVRCIRRPESGVINPNIPIIAMTANAMREDRQKCLDCGMDDYVSKPFKPAEIAELIEKWRPAPGTKVDDESDRISLVSQASENKVMSRELIDDAALLVRFMNDYRLINLLKSRFLMEMPVMLRTLNEMAGGSNKTEIRQQINKIIAVCENVECGKMLGAARSFERALDLHFPVGTKSAHKLSGSVDAELVQLAKDIEKQCNLVCLQITLSGVQNTEY